MTGINSGAPDEMIKPTNKKAVSIFEQVAPDLKTNDNGEASYKVRKHFGLPRNIFKLIFRELHGKLKEKDQSHRNH